MRRPELLLIVFLLVLPGCATTKSGPKYSARQLQTMGEKFISTGDASSALRFLTEAEEKKPDDAVIQYDLGLAYSMRGLTDKALLHFQKALKINPKYAEAWNAIGGVYAERGQIEIAQESFQKALDDPFYQTPQLPAYNLGRVYEKKGDPERALAYYQQSVKLDPFYGAAWYRIGQILETIRRGDEARHAYGKAVAGSPDLAEAHLRYGIMSYLAGDMEAALFSLSRVGRLAPNTVMADEARQYLDKLRGITRSRQSSNTSEAFPDEVEIISNSEIQRRQSQAQSPTLPTQPPKPQLAIIPQETSKPPTPQALPETPIKAKAVPVQIPAPPPSDAPAEYAPGGPATTSPETPIKAKAVPVQIPAPLPSDAPAEKAPSGPATPSPETGAFKYTVQLGSFVDREKAEEVQKNLQAKGYSTVVKPLKHQVLGKVFVLQLQPVNSISKATTLMTQLGNEVEGEPVIIKTPVAKSKESKPPEAPAASE
ncbi:MAG: tetratricopeptide repeat protein [Syntrophobacteraceae bacterium]